MALATWWAADALPTLNPLPGFRAAISADCDTLARLAGIEMAEVRAQLDGGHRPYVATLDGIPAGYEWVAGESATIGEFGMSFVLPRGDRYPWDFATLPAWRGRGLHPHLRQGIIAGEAAEAARLWIIHAPENRASCRGIAKAGSAPVDRRARSRVGAALLGVPLAPCWHCTIEAARRELPASAASCWASPGHDTRCRCTA